MTFVLSSVHSYLPIGIGLVGIAVDVMVVEGGDSVAVSDERDIVVVVVVPLLLLLDVVNADDDDDVIVLSTTVAFAVVDVILVVVGCRLINKSCTKEKFQEKLGLQ